MNSQVSHITGFSPYEMVCHQSPPDLFNLILIQKGQD